MHHHYKYVPDTKHDRVLQGTPQAVTAQIGATSALASNPQVIPNTEDPPTHPRAHECVLQ